jgi:hypothetical protein
MFGACSPPRPSKPWQIAHFDAKIGRPPPADSLAGCSLCFAHALKNTKIEKRRQKIEAMAAKARRDLLTPNRSLTGNQASSFALLDGTPRGSPCKILPH